MTSCLQMGFLASRSSLRQPRARVPPGVSTGCRAVLEVRPAARAGSVDDLWLLPENLSEKDGITAGTVNSVLGSAGLPGNTTITASPSGLAFSGSAHGATKGRGP
jgi:hypothetical protein